VSTETSQPPKKGAWSCYRFGWRKFKRYFLELFLIAVISVLASLPMGIPVDEFLFNDSTFFILGYLFLLYLPLHYGIDFAFLKASKDESPRVGDILDFFNNYLSVVAAQLLVSLIVGIGFLLLIVPGIIFMCKLAFVPYLVTYERTDALEALRLSWEITEGYSWTIFRIWLLSIPLYLLGIALVGVGLIFSTMWIGLSYAGLYYHASEQSDILQDYHQRKRTYSKSTSRARREPGKETDQGLPNLLDRGQNE